MTALAAPPTQGQAAFWRPPDPYVRTTVAREATIDWTWFEWSRVVRSLQGLNSLRDGWDGQGAAAPPAGVVATAVVYAEAFRRGGAPPPTTAGPTPAGTVLLGWRDPPAYLEVEVLAPDQVEWMSVDRNGIVGHGEF